RRRARAGGLPILLASGMVMRAKGLERTFRLTSDSIAAHIAGRTRPRRFVLLKSVAGEAAPLAGRAGAARLARLGVVDPLFPALLERGIDQAAVRLGARGDPGQRPRRQGPDRLRLGIGHEDDPQPPPRRRTLAHRPHDGAPQADRLALAGHAAQADLEIVGAAG